MFITFIVAVGAFTYLFTHHTFDEETQLFSFSFLLIAVAIAFVVEKWINFFMSIVSSFAKSVIFITGEPMFYFLIVTAIVVFFLKHTKGNRHISMLFRQIK